jgi:hypothetical protein
MTEVIRHNSPEHIRGTEDERNVNKTRVKVYVKKRKEYGEDL